MISTDVLRITENGRIISTSIQPGRTIICWLSPSRASYYRNKYHRRLLLLSIITALLLSRTGARQKGALQMGSRGDASIVDGVKSRLRFNDDAGIPSAVHSSVRTNVNTTRRRQKEAERRAFIQHVLRVIYSAENRDCSVGAPETVLWRGRGWGEVGGVI